jgi:hypothetical protein
MTEEISEVYLKGTLYERKLVTRGSLLALPIGKSFGICARFGDKILAQP